MQKSIRFFMMMLPVFFALVNPASTMANPACIQNTSAAPIRNHTANTSAEVVSATNSLIASSIQIIFFLVLFHPKQQIAVGGERPIFLGGEHFRFVTGHPQFSHFSYQNIPDSCRSLNHTFLLSHLRDSVF